MFRSTRTLNQPASPSAPGWNSLVKVAPRSPDASSGRAVGAANRRSQSQPLPVIVDPKRGTPGADRPRATAGWVGPDLSPRSTWFPEPKGGEGLETGQRLVRHGGRSASRPSAAVLAVPVRAIAQGDHRRLLGLDNAAAVTSVRSGPQFTG